MTPKQIEETILNGRTGIMPPFGAALGPDGTKDVAHYVMSLSGLPNDSIRAARGKDKFQQTCVACHGADGKGNPQLGAPDLTDRVWLYGGSEPDHHRHDRQRARPDRCRRTGTSWARPSRTSSPPTSGACRTPRRRKRPAK